MELIAKAQRVTHRHALMLPLVASALALGGCMSSPTYGTDKTANAQLMSDVSSMISLAPKKNPRIDYKPRPELVRPEKGAAGAALPPPQESVASAENPDWIESNEQRRARIGKEIDAKENPSGDSMSRMAETGIRPEYDSPVIADEDMAARASRAPRTDVDNRSDSGIRPAGEQKSQREALKKRLAETQQGSPTNRRYLSEPPLDYRQAAATAPQDDIGEDEFKKERRAKSMARKKGSSSWRDWIPGL